MTKPTPFSAQRRTFALQHLLIEQCVGQRDKEEVQFDQVEEARREIATLVAPRGDHWVGRECGERVSKV